MYRELRSLTFSSRILSPHLTSKSLWIKIRSSEVTFHWWLAKCTTAKRRPYWPVAISSFTFLTTSGEERGSHPNWKGTGGPALALPLQGGAEHPVWAAYPCLVHPVGTGARQGPSCCSQKHWHLGMWG